MSKRGRTLIADKLRARLADAAGLGFVVGVAALAYLGGVLRPIDDGFAQLRFHLLQRPASHSLTVVEIDAASLKAAGTWPWSRARFARAIDNLAAAGADLVAFDVDFSARSSETADEALGAAIRRRPGAVVLPTFVQSARGADQARLQGNSPLAALSQDAVLASVNVPVDADGRVRRYDYGFAPEQGGRASMAASLAGVPAGRTDSFLIDYGIRSSDIDHLSFEAVYSGRFDPALVRGRKVLIGSTALELGDEFATPKRGVLPGVYIHALAYESLIAGRALRELSPTVLLLLAAVAAYFLRPRSTLALAKVLRRHALVAGALLVLPLAFQAWLPVSVDVSPIIIAQALSLAWVVRAELKRRAQAVVEAREAHLIQLAMHMRRSRNRVRAANKKLKEANAALDKALKARTEFLATTSHEIRTPLNGILGMTQVIQLDRELPERVREKLGLIQGAGETMLALVDDILDVAKIETGALVISAVEMDLHRLLDEAAQLWAERAEQKGLQLGASFAKAPAWIVEDVTRLRQIVFNLMSNAVKFTESGQVSLTARVEKVGRGERLVLKVADTGIGIPAASLETIFESFRQVDGSVTRKYGGTGLGLAICRQLASAMGGEMTVRSALGEGSTFTLRLPLRRAERAAAAAPCPAPAGDLASASILLIEANPLAQSMLKAALSGQVAAIEAAGSVDAALTALELRPFDVVLGEGATLGREAADAASAIGRLAAQAPAARLAVLTGGAGEDVAALLAAGCHHVARKPISTSDLIKQLAAIVAATSSALAHSADRDAASKHKSHVMHQ